MHMGGHIYALSEKKCHDQLIALHVYGGSHDCGAVIEMHCYNEEWYWE